MKRQKGLTLIELMLSLTIGLIVMTAAISLFTLSKQTATLQRSHSKMQNESEFAMRLIVQDLKLAGFSVDNKNDFDKRPFNWFYTREGGSSTNNDSIGISYTSGESGITRDCAGNYVSTGGTILNSYSVSSNTLQCNGVDIVDNVESFQILYGIDYDGVGGPDAYVERDTAAIQFVTKKAKPIAVRISILVSSDIKYNNISPKSIYVSNEAPLYFDDKKMHLLTERSVIMYNMM